MIRYASLLLAAALALTGCATTYQKESLTGGFAEKNLGKDLRRIRFGANGYSTYETVQTYWLYRCAELAVSEGYDGFEILSDVRLTLVLPADQFARPADGGTEPAGYVYIPVPAYTGPKPQIVGDIRLLKGDVTSTPPKKFNARQLQEQLKPIVDGKKCSMGNVCPHAHNYIYGERSS